MNKIYCPRCGSDKLRWASGLPQLWSLYECLECGYRGALVVTNGEIAEKIKKEFRIEQSGFTKEK
ncbi:MAG: hypothetical protein QXU01_01245 [Candidatus Hadarchaeales archaeon]